MVLTFDTYSETLEQKKKEVEIKRLQEKNDNGMKQIKQDIVHQIQEIMRFIDISRI